MRLEHDGMREMIPDYLRGTLQGETRKDIEAHLSECEECRAELSFLKELVKFEVPDPGDLFWKTLPQRVRVAVKEEEVQLFSLRSFLLRQFPVAATIVVAFFLIFTYIKKKEVLEPDPTFVAPLTASVLDYSGITEKDIPIVTEQSRVYDLFAENFMENSYHREFVSLSSKELEGLYEALGEEQKRGG